MKQLMIVLASLFLLLNTVFTNALASTHQRISQTSSILGEERTIQIALPENYLANPTATYPVIYILDGDYNFKAVTGMLDMLANKGQLIPDVIVVAISDNGTSSYRNYMTPSFSDKQPDSASKFADYLENEVKPYIQSHYRTANNHILVGQSIGGLFVLNTLIENPARFNHYIAISPSVWVGDNAIVKKAKNTLHTKTFSAVSLHLSLADETQMGQYDLINYLDLNPQASLTWQFTHYPDENHNSVGLIALRNSLKQIFNGWHINERALATKSPQSVLTHYANLQTQWQLKQAIPTNVAHSLMRYHYRNNLVEKVPEFIKNAKQTLPQSSQVLTAKQASYVGHFDSPKNALALLKGAEKEHEYSIEHLKAIAGVYEQLGEQQNAQTYYKKALALGEKQQVAQWQLNILAAKVK
ncbi:alpha/beta hydrolase [Pseudoalteromonas sp. SSM20]|uniref:alpha/beta hydrolase n=1 Tax=Pseudoalteromonas sp. SSM20 TaxID=3139394 RepID=UPI003BAABF56